MLRSLLLFEYDKDIVQARFQVSLPWMVPFVLVADQRISLGLYCQVLTTFLVVPSPAAGHRLDGVPKCTPQEGTTS